MDTSSSPAPGSSKEATKSPTPGPFSALLVPLARDASTASAASSTGFDSGIEGMEGVEEGGAAALAARARRGNTPGAALASLQNIFRVRLHGATPAANAASGDLLDLPETSQTLREHEAERPAGPNMLEVVSDVLTETLMLMAAGTYPAGVAKKNVSCVADSMMDYLLQCYERVETENRDLKKVLFDLRFVFRRIMYHQTTFSFFQKSKEPPFMQALMASWESIVEFSCLVLRGCFDTSQDSSVAMPHSALLKPVLEQKLPGGFLLLVMEKKGYEWEEFREIFAPLMENLVRETRRASLVESSSRAPLLAIAELCDLRLNSNARPFCRLLTELDLWLPDPLTDAPGRELTYTSVLGPLMSVSVFAEEDPKVAEKYFSGKQGQAQVRAVAQQLQQDLEFLRVSSHEALEFFVTFRSLPYACFTRFS